ncbi:MULTISPECIES: zinc-binding dehydrogenase [Alphaproteobacteria]|jgi:NADPH:quinone reductase|uniref:enoyl-[acyl-carrier-protein] reductase n=4 Tax=Alphaproteobacteria TaxID=28211 RepID=A0A7W5Z802_9HYPH|nr:MULTISPECIES: zinc-binding dehydrogenase [Alphaproteobacteria]MBS46163.1 alcohol dehydrogenase [Sphingobium sp.]USQ70271.1 zinc-binding dehydrogenase [Roseomonas mucosa]HBO1273328.1 zinc-binding dehydrogenase [Pseudomonas aeruginosa]AHE54137.1 alcohol dehydrogenase [Sphingomonas sanxanigenens DSM 19645 = NX02]MBB3811292.1 NADPH:quinone reductase-like Zn-dependent oxidoreductase [Pseudochelatococcus contaminans]|tara:strand:+ start:4394 stop:5371 length:978 start_codon:yes stop_codon:yes gene_type:complete
MRSAIHTAFGEPAEVLELGDRPIPQPGPGEVRVKTTLAPIHNHDLWTIRGRYGYRPDLPAIGGSEAVGIVDALGDDVEGVSNGQRVAVASVHGTWAEYFLAPARLLVPMPEAIPDETAAQLIAMPLSALMLLEFLEVDQGQWIVQNAANGAVGKTLAMLAAARGINVLNLVRRDAGVDELAALGIDHVVSTAQPEWQEIARAILGSGLARAGIDSIGGAASAALLGLLGEGGTLVSFGTMAGEPMQIDSGSLIFKQATVKGFWGSKVSLAMSADDKRRLVGELLQRTLAGELLLPVEAVYDLADAAQAAAASLQPARKGKVLLRP